MVELYDFLSDLCGREDTGKVIVDYIDFLSDLCGREAIITIAE